MEARDHDLFTACRESFIARLFFQEAEDETDETRDESDDSDDSDATDYSQQREFNYNCIVKSILAGVITATAIFMVVIMAANRKSNSPAVRLVRSLFRLVTKKIVVWVFRNED